ncbi:MAG: SDR family NAD(P)-dependent oxidoreductase, partial [Chloroflexota bacterium]|nr:SDR family NAD(P)-dependent oxidoreductase [Chloroflexota bacterium]
MDSNGERLTVKDKVVLVTGAASGIGRSIAELFAQSGAYVLVNDVVESGREVADSIGGAFLRADLADVEQVRSLATRALEARGKVDILVNNAGYQHVAPVEEFPEEQWMKLVQVMLTAPFQLTRRLLPGMKGRGWGRIINIASIHGLVASPYKSAYVSAKHGLIGLTKAVALEAGAYGVTVNAICPSYVRTPLVEGQVKEQAR